jgi:peptidoglycan/xylan/chitin deacetylase (PgdA/CDA1 family)
MSKLRTTGLASLTLLIAVGATAAGSAAVDKTLSQRLTLGTRSVRTRQKVIALTFDDGPDPRFTPHVLRILTAAHVPATFFVLGGRVESHPDLIRQESADGFEIECHGWDHRDLEHLPADQILEMYKRCRDEVRSVTGNAPTLVRPPYGLLSSQQSRRLESAGFTVVYWTSDFVGKSTDPHKEISKIVSRARGGGIILMHDGRHDRSCNVAALPLLIKELRAKGFRFVTISSLMKDGPMVPEPYMILKQRSIRFRLHEASVVQHCSLAA